MNNANCESQPVGYATFDALVDMRVVHMLAESITQEEATKAANPDDILVSDWWSKYYECVGNDPKLKRIFKERNLPKIKVNTVMSSL